MTDSTNEPKPRLPRPRAAHLIPVATALMGAAAAWWGTRRRHVPLGTLTAPKIMTAEDFERTEPNRGRCANYPWTIPSRGWKDILWRTIRESSRDRLPVVAGGVTFFVFLAVFPAAAAFISLYGMFANPSDIPGQLAQMALVVPDEVVSVISDNMVRIATDRPAALSGAFIAALAISIWSSTAGMKALLDGLNIAYGETEKRQYVPFTIASYAATGVALVFLALITTALVAVPVYIERTGVQGLMRIWITLRWGVVLGLAALAFALLYKYGPSREPARWRWVTGGGAVASVLWMGGSMGFSWYINNISHIDVIYGSLGAFVAFMVWVWFSIMVMLIGAELNAEIEHQTAVDTTTGEPRPMGQRGAVMADTVGRAFTISPQEGYEIITAFCVRFFWYCIDFSRRQVGHVVNFFRRVAASIF